MSKYERVDLSRIDWVAVMRKLGYAEHVFNGKPQACPACGDGGKGVKSDRFIFDQKKGPGTLYCRVCHIGQCKGLHAAVRGISQKDALIEIIKASEGRLDGVRIPSAPYVAPLPVGPNLAMKARIEKILAQCQPVTIATPVAQWIWHRVPGFDIKTLSSDILYHPRLALKHLNGEFSHHPAMVAVARDREGKVELLHRTFLTMAGRKLMDNCRLYYGPVTDGKFRSVLLREGPSPETTLIGEGLETMFSIQKMDAVGHRIEACLDRGHIAKYEWMDGCKRLVNYGDFDFIDPKDGARPGHAASAKLCQRLEGTGIKYITRFPPNEGTDWNDVYLERRARELELANTPSYLR